jgi:HlyD family secretion protein
LYSEKAVSKNELDKATSNRDSLRAQLASASASLALMREGSRSEDIKSAEASVELAAAQLKSAENSLQDTKLFSPSNGTILTRITEPGAIVSIGQPVYALALKTPLQVRAHITEPQLGHVRLGMKGKIYTDSFSEPIDGVVNFIAPEAEFTPKQVQTPDLRTSLVYRIRLLIGKNPEERLKNGMPVTIEIMK